MKRHAAALALAAFLLAGGPATNADARPVSEPTTATAPADDAGPDEASRKREARKKAATPLVVVTVAAILVVAIALGAWIIHWGNRLRRPSRGRPPGGDASDPWSEAGQRLNVEDEPTRPEERE